MTIEPAFRDSEPRRRLAGCQKSLVLIILDFAELMVGLPREEADP